MKNLAYSFFCILLLTKCDLVPSEEIDSSDDHSSSEVNEVNIDTSSVTDIDDNEYKTVIVGDHEWMAQNLRTSKYNDGSEIPSISEDPMESLEVLDTTSHGFHLEISKSTKNKFGKYYNWLVVTDERSICPEGWRVPSDSDWKKFEENVMSKFDITNDKDDVKGLGNYLKSCRQLGSPLGGDCDTSEPPRWVSNHDALDFGDNPHYGKDKVKFSALPGGYYMFDNYPRYTDPWAHKGGIEARWWSATEDSNKVYIRRLYYHAGDLRKMTSGNEPRNFYNIRCITDYDNTKN